MELKITRCRSHENLRCPKCAAAIKSTDIIALGAHADRLTINCVSCHVPVLYVEFVVDDAGCCESCPYTD